MSNAPLDILIVEDENENIADAQREMQRRVDLGANIRLEYARNLREALEKVRSVRYGGVISDVFFPSGMDDQEDHDVRFNLSLTLLGISNGFPSRITEWVQTWKLPHIIAPLGVSLAEHFNDKESGLIKEPAFVFCTSTYHHGDRTELVGSYSRRNWIPFVDASELSQTGRDSEAPKKHWDTAYETMLRELALVRLGKAENCRKDYRSDQRFKGYLKEIRVEYRSQEA